MKSAALVEYNVPDCVGYLKRVFAGAGEKTLASIEQWGREEVQHGLAFAIQPPSSACAIGAATIATHRLPVFMMDFPCVSVVTKLGLAGKASQQICRRNINRHATPCPEL